MGLEYLKAMKLERAFIIFKRIEYFLFHRLTDHVGINTFSSPAKDKIMARIPMIMFVAQQIIIDFVMPVYERQAAYFRYEELQRRLRILNAPAWLSIREEALRREAEFYQEAESISTRFGVELASFLPQEVIPDDNHPSNFPPRTYPTASSSKKVDATVKNAIQAAIDAMNQCIESPPGNPATSGEQPVDVLIRNVNTMMNDALTNFFRIRGLANGQSFASLPSSSVDHTKADVEQSIQVIPDQAERRNTYSPTVDHMYRMPPIRPETTRAYVPPVETSKNPLEYNPSLSLETYVDLLQKTFDQNTKSATGYRVMQKQTVTIDTRSHAGGYMMHLIAISSLPPGYNMEESETVCFPGIRRIAVASGMMPEPDPGKPRVDPPTKPIPENKEPTPSFGVWEKRGAASGPSGDVGSLGVLSDLDRAREVLDAAPPMPAAINKVGAGLPKVVQAIRPVVNQMTSSPRKRPGSSEEKKDYKRISMGDGVFKS